MILLLHSCFSGLNLLHSRVFFPLQTFYFFYSRSFTFPSSFPCSRDVPLDIAFGVSLQLLLCRLSFPCFFCFVFVFVCLYFLACFCVVSFILWFYFSFLFFCFCLFSRFRVVSLFVCLFSCFRIFSLYIFSPLNRVGISVSVFLPCLSVFLFICLCLFLSLTVYLYIYLPLTFTLSLPHSFTYSIPPSLTHSFAYSLPPLLSHAFASSFIYSLTLSLPHTLTHSLTLSLTHSLIHSHIFFFIFTAPAGPPQDVSVHLVNLTHASVTWRPPEADLQHGVITGYQVSDHVF